MRHLARAAFVFGLALVLAGCLPKIPVKVLPGEDAQIVSLCPQCLGENAGYAPLSVVFYAEAPEDAEEYLWSFGDGSGGRGRLVQHTFELPGTFEVVLTATKRVNRVLYQSTGKTAVFVLAPPTSATRRFSYANAFVSVVLILPPHVALGEEFLVQYIITTKVPLVYIDLRSIPNERIYAEHDGYFQKLHIPAGKTLEFSYKAKAISQGDGAVDTILLAAGKESIEELREHAAFLIGNARQ